MWIFRSAVFGLLCAIVAVVSQSKEGDHLGIPAGTASSVAAIGGWAVLLSYQLAEFWQAGSSIASKLLMVVLFAAISLIGASILFGLGYLISIRLSST